MREGRRAAQRANWTLDAGAAPEGAGGSRRGRRLSLENQRIEPEVIWEFAPQAQEACSQIRVLEETRHSIRDSQPIQYPSRHCTCPPRRMPCRCPCAVAFRYQIIGVGTSYGVERRHKSTGISSCQLGCAAPVFSGRNKRKPGYPFRGRNRLRSNADSPARPLMHRPGTRQRGSRPASIHGAWSCRQSG